MRLMELETASALNLEAQSEALESKEFKISWSKAKCMKCQFSNTKKEDNGTNNIEGDYVKKKKDLQLGSIVHQEGDIEDDIRNRKRLTAKMEKCFR